MNVQSSIPAPRREQHRAPHLLGADSGFAVPQRSRRVRRAHVLEADIFATAVAREQKRVDRSDRAFAILTVELSEGSSAELLREVVGAVAAATRGADLIGWLRRDEAVVVLLTDLHEPNFAQAVNLESRLRRDLATFVGTAESRRFSVRLQVHTNTRRTALQPESRQERLHDVLKRTLDLAGSLSLLTLLSPVLLLVAAAVKLTSKGPILFRQERVGLGMKPFTMLKFRSMRTNAGHGVHQAYVTQFINGGAAAAAAAPGVFKLTNDDRITPIGRFIRKTSLDELPQLLNVVRGDMSLVGPRPPIKYEVDQYKGWHRRRMLDAKPGLTGLWQVTGRSRTTFDEMVRLDLRYARISSLWTDLKILLLTPRAVIAGKGAC
jgi:lipopolysaccharide/colanic/teichoic acid biosynthesis glycosyltransferase